MAGLVNKSFDNPDETRSPDKTTVSVVRLTDDVSAARFTMQPGWSWTECIKPVAGTDQCQNRHVGVAISGRLSVSHSDGSEAEVGPGEAYYIGPGHDAHVVGEEPFVSYEFDAKSAQTYGT